MFCHHCGSQIADDATTCIHCGTATPPASPKPKAAPPGMMYCRNCGAHIPREAFVCVHCGVKAGGALDPLGRALFPERGRSWLVALALCGFGGWLGLHRFYIGKLFTGLLQLVTGGGFMIWWIIDLIRIVAGSFRDDEGLPLVR